MLRDCTVALKFWRLHIANNKSHLFFSKSESNWLKLNCCDNVIQLTIWPTTHWSVIFLVAIWTLSKFRNKFVFEKVEVPLNTLLIIMKDSAFGMAEIFY